MYHKLTKKLFNLFTGELAATMMFAGIWLMFLHMHEWSKPYLTSFAPVFSFLVLEFLLLQGSYYWYIKWKQAKCRDFSFLPKKQLTFFRGLKRVNLLLLGVGFVLFLYQWISYPKEIYWFLFLYLFTLAEYINYYHVRLSYQTMEEIKSFLRYRKFRRSKLAEELNK